MKLIVCFLSLTFTALLAGCSAGTSSAIQAASYSNASLTGTYSINFTSFASNGLFTSTGTFSADGNGGISSGVLTAYYFGGDCTETFTGTYAIQTNGSGTATVIGTPGGSSPCANPLNRQLAVQVTQQGQAVSGLESDGTAIASGDAYRK